MIKSSSLNKLEKEVSKVATRQAKELKYYSRIASEENRREQRKDSFFNNNDDRLRFSDFYKMSSNLLTYLNEGVWVGIFIAGIIYFTPLMFEFAAQIELYFPWGWQTFIGLLISIYSIAFLVNITQALYLQFIFDKLPYNLIGLGRLVHRCKGQRYFRRSAISLVLNTKAKIGSISDDDIKDMELNILKLLAGRANKVLFKKRIMNTWTVKDGCAIGYANWRVSSELLRCLNKNLSPIQHEFDIVDSVNIEFPIEGGVENYFEWTPEGD